MPGAGGAGPGSHGTPPMTSLLNHLYQWDLGRAADNIQAAKVAEGWRAFSPQAAQQTQESLDPTFLGPSWGLCPFLASSDPLGVRAAPPRDGDSGHGGTGKRAFDLQETRRGWE